MSDDDISASFEALKCLDVVLKITVIEGEQLLKDVKVVVTKNYAKRPRCLVNWKQEGF